MEDKSTIGPPNAQLKAANILFNALVVGVILFAVIAVALIKFNGPFSDLGDRFERIFLVIVSLVAVVCLVAAFSGYRKRISSLNNPLATFDEKFNNYRASMISYLALCEGPALFAVMAFLLTANYWFLLITVAMLTAMIFKQPTKQRVINELQLSSQDQQEL